MSPIPSVEQFERLLETLEPAPQPGKWGGRVFVAADSSEYSLETLLETFETLAAIEENPDQIERLRSQLKRLDAKPWNDPHPYLTKAKTIFHSSIAYLDGTYIDKNAILQETGNQEETPSLEELPESQPQETPPAPKTKHSGPKAPKSREGLSWRKLANVTALTALSLFDPTQMGAQAAHLQPQPLTFTNTSLANTHAMCLADSSFPDSLHLQEHFFDPEAQPSSPSLQQHWVTSALAPRFPEETELLQTKAFIQNPHIHLTDNDLAHLIGDFFGKDSHLEGSQSDTALRYYRQSLQHLLEAFSEYEDEGQSPAPPNDFDAVIAGITPSVSPEQQALIAASRRIDPETLKQLLSKIEKAREIYDLFDEYSLEGSRTAEFLSTSLTSLEKGDSIFFPGGWAGDPSGHIMYYEYIAEGDKQFTLRIYNTGSGLEYHSNQTVAYKDQFLTFTERCHIPLENIVSLPCLKAMHELAHVSKTAQWGPQDIYETLQSVIGGEVSDHVYTTADLQSAQRSGMCGFWSFQSLLRHHLDSGIVSGRLQWEVVFKAVYDYAEQNEGRLSSEELPRRLLDKSLEELARITENRFRDGSINLLERNFATKQIDRIKDLLNESEAEYLAQVAARAPVLQMGSLPDQVPQVFGKTGSITPLVTPETATAKVVPSYEPFNFNDLALTTESIVDDLQTFSRYVDRAMQAGNPTTALEDFRQLLDRLPLFGPHEQADPSSLWFSLSPEQKTTAITTLSTLAKQTYRACFEDVRLHPGHTQTVEPRTLVSFLKAHTIAIQLFESTGLDPKLPLTYFYPDALKLFSQKNDRTTYYSYYSVQAGGEVDKQKQDVYTPYFRTYDPALDKTISEIDGYWRIQSFKYMQQDVVWDQSFGAMRNPGASTRGKREDLYTSPSYKWEDRSLFLWLKEYEKPIFQGLASTPANHFRRFDQFLIATFDTYFASEWSPGIQIPRTLLPSYFYDLRDLKQSMEALKGLPLVFDNPNESNNQGFSFIGNLIDHGNMISWQQYATFAPSFNLPLTGYPKNSTESYDGYIKDWTHIKNAHRLIKNEDLNQLLNGYKDPLSEDTDFRRDRENLLVTQDLKQKEGVKLDIQTQRELRRLIAVRQSQVKRTLEYFKKHPELLREPDYQTFFKLLMFEPDLLGEQLQKPQKDVEHLIRLLGDFTTSNYRSFINNEDLSTATFFLHLNSLFSNYLEHAGWGSQAAAHLMDTRHEIRQVLKQNNLSPNTRSLFNQELALSYRGKEDLSPQESLELATAAFHAKLKNVNMHKENAFAIEQLISRWLPSIEKSLTDENRDTFLNQLVEIAIGSPSEASWKPNPHFPAFISSDGTYRIDLREQTLQIESSQLQSKLPEDIISHPIIQRLFAQDIPTIGNKLAQNHYEFESTQGKYRIILNANQFVLQKLFVNPSSPEGEWFQYISESEIGSEFRQQGLVKGQVSWLSLRNPEEITVADPIKHAPLYRITCEPSFLGTKEIKLITKIPKKQGDPELIIQYIEDTASPWGFLTHFEAPSYISLWKHPKTGLPMTLELPRFGEQGLTFTREEVGNKTRFVSANFPGFSLAEKQHVPALKDFPHFLLLENRSGGQKVLIPRQPFVKDLEKGSKKSSSLETTKGSLFRQETSVFLEKQTALSYTVDKKSGRLIPESEEGRLYLSMLYLWKMEYATALQYLKGTGSSLRPLNDEEHKILYAIASLKEQNLDQDPRGTAIRLHAALLIAKDNDIRTRDVRGTPRPMPELASIYQEYLDQLSNIPSGRLSVEEELSVLDAIADKNAAMLNRLNSLSPLKGKEALAYLASSASRASWPASQAELPQYAIPVRKIIKQSAPSFKVSDSDYFFFAYQKARDEKEVPYILRPATLQYLDDGYRLARGEASSKKALRFFENLTGIEVQNYNPADFQQALQLMLPQAGQYEVTALHLFQALLEHPEAFPDAKTFENILQESASKKEDVSKEGLRKLEEQVFVPLRRIVKDKELAYQAQEAAEAANRAPPPAAALPANIALESPSQQIAQQYRFSVRLVPSGSADYPVVNDLSLVGIHATQAVSDDRPLEDLQALFDVDVKDPVAEKELTKTADSVERYQTSQASQKRYEIEDPQQWKAFQSTIDQSLSNRSAALMQEELSLLEAANRVFSQESDYAGHRLERLGGTGGPLTMDDLVQLFWRRDAALFHVHNPALSPEEIIQLEDRIVRYLEQATHVQHLNRLSKKMAEVETAQAAGMPRNEIDELVKQAASMAAATRTYDVAEHPEYLVLEYYMDILMREDQTKNLDLLDIRQGRIGRPDLLGIALEMIMGGGKSSVLLPLIGMLHADGEHISIVVMTPRLLPSSGADLSKALGTVSKKGVQAIAFTRETRIDEDTLTGILKQLNSVRDRRQVLLMTSDSIESLYLKSLEHLYRFSLQPEGDHSGFMKEWGLIRDIFTLLKTQGRVLIDEADLILNPRKERHFTLGFPFPFDTQEGRLIGLLYQTLLTNPKIQSVMSFDFSEEINAPSFSPTKYREEVIPLLVKSLLSEKLGTTDKEVTDFFDGLQPDTRSTIEAYLYHSTAPDVLQRVSGMPAKVRNLLALAKQEMHVLLPLTCDKQDGIDYGTTPRKDFAIPFHGSNKPAEGSQFKNYEAAGYTYQTYLRNGIPQDFIAKKIDLLKAQGTQEIKENPEKLPRDTEAARHFQALCGGDPQFSLFDPDLDIEVVTASINQDFTKKLNFVRQMVLPQITTSPLTLSTNPQLFNFLFETVLGFTGTLWNADSFPAGMLALSDNTVAGKTLGILWNNSQGKVHRISTPKIETFARDLIGKYPQLHHARAIIDTAGLARGISNEEVAHQLLALPELQAKNINAIVFYNVAEEQMILERGEGGEFSIKPLAAASVPLKQRLVFYDQPHTTGADVSHYLDTVGVTTIGKHIILRDLLQSVWRLRGLDKSQKIEFVYDEETEAAIRSTWLAITQQPLEGDIDLKHILLFATYNQALLQGDNNYRALKHKMKAVLQAAAFAALLDPNRDAQQLRTLFKEVEDLFIEKTVSSPWEMFGLPETPIEASQVVQDDVAKWERYPAFQVLAAITPQSLAPALKTLADNALAVLPTSLTKSSQDIQQEVEEEQEQEKETEKEKEIEAQKQVEDDPNKIRIQYLLDPTARWNAASFHDFQPSAINNEQEVCEKLLVDKRQFLGFHSCKPGDPFPLISIDSTLAAHADLAPYRDVFDPALLGTLNLMPAHYDQASKAPYHPFDFDQKTVADLLFVKRPNGLAVVMLDLNDSANFETILRDNDLGLEAAIYNFELGLHVQGKRPLPPEELQQDPAFTRLVVQAKFFNGETHFSPTELPVLEAWIREKGIERMRTLFHEVILGSDAKSSSRSAYPSSPIGKLFHRIMQE